MKTHVITFDASTFRQALVSASLYLNSKAFSSADALGNICIHHSHPGMSSATISALDGHGFYHQRLACFDGDGCQASLPLPPQGIFGDIGQLLLSTTAVSTIVKMLPTGKGFKGTVTITVTEQPTNECGQTLQEVKVSLGNQGSCGFTVSQMSFVDYTVFLTRAEQNKERLEVIQGRSFPAKEYARIAKALPTDAFFLTYWGDKHDSPVLVEYGDDIMIVFMPGTLPNAANDRYEALRAQIKAA